MNTLTVLRRSLTLTCALVLVGCASGPSFQEARDSIPPVQSGQGRVFFYRKTAMGAAIQPAIKLNGEKVGTAKPRGFFYVDRPPGAYEVETKTEVARRLSFTLDDQQTRYVRFDMSFGFFVGHVSPELVEPAIGEAEVAKCRLAGGGLQE
jgi:hypothetical protein